jgi:hypothetical protein
MSAAASSMALFFTFVLIVVILVVVSRRLVIRRQRELLQSTLVHPEGLEVPSGRAITGWSSPRVAPSFTSPDIGDNSDGRTGPSDGDGPRDEQDQQRQHGRPQRLSRLQQLQIIEMQQMVDEERALQQAVEASIYHRSGETAPEQTTAGGGEDPALQRALEVSSPETNGAHTSMHSYTHIPSQVCLPFACARTPKAHTFPSLDPRAPLGRHLS